MPPRIRLRPDQLSLPCRALRHAYDFDATQVFIEDSMYYGRVWVAYDECLRDCGVIRLTIKRPGGRVTLGTRYRRTNPDYDTTMSMAEAQAQHMTLALAATPQTDPIPVPLR
jgi:hypothetical protein